MTTSRFIPHILLISLTMTVASCGIKLGGGVPDDPTPSGTLVASGPFTSENSNAPSEGTAAVYMDDSGDYTLVISGIDLPTASGMEILANGNINIGTLQSPDGTVNYPVSGVTTWSSVVIYSETAQQPYLQASLVP